MKIYNTMLVIYCVLFFAGIGMYIGARRINWNKMMRHSRGAFVKAKKSAMGSVEVQLLPSAAYNRQLEATDTDYIVRIKLTSNESLKQDMLSQYMNFGISKNFFAVQGGNMLEQTACEKIPCIIRNEFIYMACFHRRAVLVDSSLLIYVADSLAGFGNNKFEFTSKTLQQLD